MSSFTQEDASRSIPVDLKPFGNYFILRTRASDRHAGIFDNSELIKILGQFSLRLDTTLLIPETMGLKQPMNTKSKSHDSAFPVENYRLRIVLHGLKSDGESIGKLLADAGFFLQHPSAAELLPDVEYDNPHFLLQFGEKMPKVEDLSMEIGGDAPSQEEMDDGTRSSNPVQIFESAANDGVQVTHLTVTPSPRLRSVLMV